MTNYTGEAADGEIYGQNAVYATARSTSTAADTAGTTARIGQDKTGGGVFSVLRSFLSFDTSGIDNRAKVVTAKLYVRAGPDMSAIDFNVQVYRYDWTEALGGASTEANYDGAYGLAAVLEGTLRDTSAGWVDGEWYSIDVTPALINRVGDTKYALVSSRDVAGTEPADATEQQVYIRTADNAGSEPYLAITVQLPGFAAII